jgi:hypothetical protein
MSYDSTRQNEQLRILDHTIDDFVDRYNASQGIDGGGPRQTVFLFPGGMASKLKRARTAWQAGVTGPQVFDYDTTWITPETFLGGARDLKLTRVATGDYRDKGQRIVIADGVVNLFGVSPYVVFTQWCSAKGVDWYIFPWDWRRAVDDAGTFFLQKFLPHFRQRVLYECNNADPLADCSIIGHSAGGMVVNWVARQGDPALAGLRAAITVASPFYGYGGQLHRWFEGEQLLNGPFDWWRSGIIKAICSFPSCYSWQFMSQATYAANAAALAADTYALPAYPSLDATSPAIADPFNPLNYGPKGRYPSPSDSGFDVAELDRGRMLAEYLASPMTAAVAQRFYCVRGVTNAYTTLSATTWQWVPPTSPSPITDVSVSAGDTSQPAWSARLVGLPAGHVGTVVGDDVEHQKIMDSPKTIQQIASVLSIPYP